MLLFFTCLGLVPATILFIYRGWRHLPSLFLSILFIALSAYFFYWYGLIALSGNHTFYNHCLGGAVFLAGPALYGYTTGLSGKILRPGQMVLHLIPAGAYFLFLASVQPDGAASGSASEFGWIGQTWIQGLPGLGRALPGPSAFIGPMVFLGYVLWAGSSLRQGLGNKDSRPLVWHTSLQLLLFTFAVGTSFLGFETAGPGGGEVSQEMAGAFSWFFLFNFGAISTLPFCFPEVLYGRASFRVAGQPDPVQVGEEGEENSRRNNQQFSPGYLQELSARIITFMEQEKPYLDPRLNLVHFSVLTGIPTHHLAYYFRNKKDQSFTEYRNAWRVQHAKMLISQGYAEIMTLEAIGTQSGFSSRNAFLTAFKKHAGLPPRDFMQQNNPARKYLGTVA
jgi:AraC-like DNA-binding protein